MIAKRKTVAGAPCANSWRGLLGGLMLATLALGDAGAQDALDRLTIKTVNGDYQFEVEIADDEAERSTGLMNRQTMAANHGMLFDFGETSQVFMWMKNTPMSLDMVFARPDGIVVSVAERTVPLSLDTISSGAPVSHVLEIKAGVARLIGLKPGDRLVHPSFGSK